MQFILKNNKKYLIVFIICLIFLIYGGLSDLNIPQILKRALLEPGYIEKFFSISGDRFPGIENVSPNFINLIIYLFKDPLLIFDSMVVFGTKFFQLVIPLFAVISGIEFYKCFHSIYNYIYVKESRFQKFILKKVLINAIKLSIAIFVAYFIYLIIVYLLTSRTQDIETTRDFLLDIFGDKLYMDYRFLYYTLEGFIRFFVIPFVYACLAQAGVLVFQNLKEVIALPILYYYLLSAIGYAIAVFNEQFAIYINPSVIMANGSYSEINSIFLIGVNIIPLLISIIIIFKRSKYVEI